MTLNKEKKNFSKIYFYFELNLVFCEMLMCSQWQIRNATLNIYFSKMLNLNYQKETGILGFVKNKFIYKNSITKDLKDNFICNVVAYHFRFSS